MKKEIKVGIIVAIVEAILALIVGFILYFFQADSIEKKTVETLAGYFDEIDKNMSYEQVMNFLYESSKEKDEIIESLRSENQELIAFKEIISSDDYNKETIDSAQAFADSGKYEKALAILNSVSNKTPQMEVMINEIQKDYENQIITRIDSMIYEEKYDEAILEIDNALKIIKNSPKLEQKKEALAKSKPQIFMNIFRPYESKGYYEKTSGQFMEMGSTKYYNGFQLGESWSTAYAIFNLNGSYQNLSGIIGHVDGSGDSDKTVLIFADGILIETYEIGYQNLPFEFSVNVTGVKQLKIERTDGSTQTGFAELIIK